MMKFFLVELKSYYTAISKKLFSCLQKSKEVCRSVIHYKECSLASTIEKSVDELSTVLALLSYCYKTRDLLINIVLFYMYKCIIIFVML